VEGFTRQGFVDLLAEHDERRGVRDMRAHCTCGWNSVYGDRKLERRAHLAEILYGYAKGKADELIADVADPWTYGG
jgi:hypothetical protein